MTKKYHSNKKINLIINTFLNNEEYITKFLNGDMFVNDRWINGIQSVFNLSRSDAEIVADIVFTEFYYQ